MKRLVLTSFIAVLALAQGPTDRYVTHSSDAEQRLGKAVIHLSGNVETQRDEGSPLTHFSADSIVIEADGVRLDLRSMEYNQDMQEIVLHGDVRLRTK
jgi:hypothetical protein